MFFKKKMISKYTILFILLYCSYSRQYETQKRFQTGIKHPIYQSISRYHPQTFHNVAHNLQSASSQVEFNQNFHEMPQTQNFHNIPEELEAEGDSQVQYAYQGGESHEGEVINENHENHNDMNYHPEHSYSPPSQGYTYGYHYRPPPLPPPTPPHHLVPQKSKQHPAPYTYYYIGRHLWYIPLYFSIYFIVYVGLLVLKSIARHKVLFPENLQAAAGMTNREVHVLRAIEQAKKRYLM